MNRAVFYGFPLLYIITNIIGIEMAPLPTLALARRICSAFLKDDFMLVIIYGELRMGKSAYALKVLGQVYDYLKDTPLSVDLVDRYLGWHPTEVIDDWFDIEKRIPMYIWDDAGYWLFSLKWHDRLMVAIQQYMNVIGTDMNCLVLTTPDPTWILGKIVGMPGTIRVKVYKRMGGISDAPSKLYARHARGYKPYRSPDLKKTGVNRILDDDFSCYIPDDVYSFYFPKREKYTRMAKLEIRRVLRDQMSKDKAPKKVDDRIGDAIAMMEKQDAEGHGTEG